MRTLPTVIPAPVPSLAPRSPPSRRGPQPSSSSDCRLPHQPTPVSDPRRQSTVEVRNIAVTQRVQGARDERGAGTRVAEHDDATTRIEAGAMPGAVAIGSELDDATRHADRPIDGATFQLLRLTYVDQHHVAVAQLGRQIGGTQVLHNGSRQADLHVDVLHVRIVTHAANRDDRLVP